MLLIFISLRDRKEHSADSKTLRLEYLAMLQQRLSQYQVTCRQGLLLFVATMGILFVNSVVGGAEDTLIVSVLMTYALTPTRASR